MSRTRFIAEGGWTGAVSEIRYLLYCKPRFIATRVLLEFWKKRCERSLDTGRISDSDLSKSVTQIDVKCCDGMARDERTGALRTPLAGLHDEMEMVRDLTDADLQEYFEAHADAARVQ